MYQKIINNLIKEIPCPVHICSYKEIKRITGRNVGGYLKPVKLKTTGAFLQEPLGIFVYKYQNKKQQIYTLIHEYGHLLCYKKGCDCLFSYPRKMPRIEYHAEMFTLKYLYKYKYKTILKEFIKAVEKHIKKHKYTPYAIATNKLMKTKTWEKAIIFAEI